MAPEIKRLSQMMKPYEGAQHSVVAFNFRDGQCNFAHAGKGVSEAPCDQWIFEIGSITKVFTGILLCVLIEENKVDPRAPLREMSEALANVPDWITPERLTTHTSGLPNLFIPLWKALLDPQPEGPYADFSRADLLEWFRNRRFLSRAATGRYAYSNFGVGLLGEAMALMAGKPFAHLLAEKVTEPLGLKDTTDCLASDQQNRLAAPKTTKGKPIPPWTFQSLAAAGCLRSTARDLACFANHVIHAVKTRETALDRAIYRSTLPILGLGPKGAMTPKAQCYGWLSVTMDTRLPGFLFHNGGTAGSSCALYICPERNAAFAILSNNGVAGNLWARAKLDWTDPWRQAHNLFALSGSD